MSCLRPNQALRAITLSLVCLALCSCGPSVVRHDRPLSLAEAQRVRETDFPFPASAHDIHYAIYQDFMAPFEFLLRFDAPPEDCIATISKALAWHQHGEKIPGKFQPVELTDVTPLPSSSYLHPVRWWDDTVVHQGFFAGEDSSHAPTIWVDSQSGKFYYRVLD